MAPLPVLTDSRFAKGWRILVRVEFKSSICRGEKLGEVLD